MTAQGKEYQAGKRREDELDHLEQTRSQGGIAAVYRKYPSSPSALPDTSSVQWQEEAHQPNGNGHASHPIINLQQAERVTPHETPPTTESVMNAVETQGQHAPRKRRITDAMKDKERALSFALPPLRNRFAESDIDIADPETSFDKPSDQWVEKHHPSVGKTNPLAEVENTSTSPTTPLFLEHVAADTFMNDWDKIWEHAERWDAPSPDSTIDVTGIEPAANTEELDETTVMPLTTDIHEEDLILEQRRNETAEKLAHAGYTWGATFDVLRLEGIDNQPDGRPEDKPQQEAVVTTTIPTGSSESVQAVPAYEQQFRDAILYLRGLTPEQLHQEGFTSEKIIRFTNMISGLLETNTQLRAIENTFNNGTDVDGFVEFLQTLQNALNSMNGATSLQKERAQQANPEPKDEEHPVVFHDVAVAETPTEDTSSPTNSLAPQSVNDLDLSEGIPPGPGIPVEVPEDAYIPPIPPVVTINQTAPVTQPLYPLDSKSSIAAKTAEGQIRSGQEPKAQVAIPDNTRRTVVDEDARIDSSRYTTHNIILGPAARPQIIRERKQNPAQKLSIPRRILRWASQQWSYDPNTHRSLAYARQDYDKDYFGI